MSGFYPPITVGGIGRGSGFFGLKNAALFNTQNFLSSGTWTKPTAPAGKSIIGYIVTVIGGGGGGGSGGSNDGSGPRGGKGGAGGGYAKANFTPATFPASVVVTIGAGGLGYPQTTITSNAAIGSPAGNIVRISQPGGNSSFGTFISATGATGGFGEGLDAFDHSGSGTVTGPGQSFVVTSNGGAGGDGLFSATPNYNGLANSPGPPGGGGGAEMSIPANAGGLSGSGATGGTAGIGTNAGNGANGPAGGGGGAATSASNINLIAGSGGNAQVAGGGGGASGCASSPDGNLLTAGPSGNGGNGSVTVTTLFG